MSASVGPTVTKTTYRQRSRSRWSVTVDEYTAIPGSTNVKHREAVTEVPWYELPEWVRSQHIRTGAKEIATAPVAQAPR